MGGIIAGAIAGITYLIATLAETALTATVLYLGAEGVLAIASSAVSALAAYSVSAALGSVVGAYTTLAISLAGASLGAALIFGVAVGIGAGVALSALPEKTLRDLVPEEYLINRLVKPLIEYVVGKPLQARDVPGGPLRSRSRQSIKRPMSSPANDSGAVRKRRALVDKKRVSAPRRQVVQPTRSMRKKGR